MSGLDANGRLSVTLPLQVQTYDIDFADHVNNQVYVRWLEDLRMAFLRAHCPLEDLLARDQAPILHSTWIEYRRPLRLFDAPVGHMWCVTLGRATVTLEAEIRVEDQVAAFARQRGVLIDVKRNRPVRWPAELLTQRP